MDRLKPNFYLFFNWLVLMLAGWELLIHLRKDPLEIFIFTLIAPSLIAWPAILSRKIRDTYRKSSLWLVIERVSPMLTKAMATILVLSIFSMVIAFISLLSFSETASAISNQLIFSVVLIPGSFVGWVTFNNVWTNLPEGGSSGPGKKGEQSSEAQKVGSLLQRLMSLPAILVSFSFGKYPAAVCFIGLWSFMMIATYRFKSSGLEQLERTE